MSAAASRVQGSGAKDEPAPIALFLPALLGGGAERVMLDLASCFTQQGYAVDMVLAKAEGPYLPDLPPGVRLIDLRARRTAGALLPLARYLRRERPAALLSTLEHANVVALLARTLAGVPLRLVIREANTPAPAQRGSPMGSRVVGWLGRRLYPRADAVVAVSEGVAGYLGGRYRLQRGRTVVIYNPVLTSRVFELASANCGHPWFAPGQPPVVLGVGRLSGQKDFASLLRAFARVRRDRPLRLMLLGEGEERGRLEALGQELGISGDLALPGFVGNPFAYMARAAAFVLSSRHEGLPNVLIQALALGAPVVSTDCPSGPREILEDGKYGPLVPVGDPEAMARALAERLGCPRRVPDQDWLARYGATAAAQRYLEVLGMAGGHA